MKKLKLTTILLLLSAALGFGQNLTQTVRGTQGDSDNKSPLTGGSINGVVKAAYLILTIFSVLGSLFFFANGISTREKDVAISTKSNLNSTSPSSSFSSRFLQNSEKDLLLIFGIL